MGSLVTIEIPPGEALDRLTILEIKRERISDETKLSEVQRAYDKIALAIELQLPEVDAIGPLVEDLRTANAAIWNAEEILRRPDPSPSELFSAFCVVTQNNNKRARLKRDIDLLLDAGYTEVKSYDLSQDI